MPDEVTRVAVDDLLDALQPLDVRARAIFGGYCFYVNEKVAGLVCDGRIFVKRSDCLVIIPTADGSDSCSIQELLPCPYHSPDASPERFVRFHARYYDAVVSGRKTATTRFNDSCVAGPAWLLFEFDDEYKRLRARIDSVETKILGELTDEDAGWEGERTAADLRRNLRVHSPDIDAVARVDFVRFTVLPDADES